MSDDEIIAVVKAAFRPLRCTACLDDYEDKLKVAVFGEEPGPPIVEARSPIHLLSERNNLDTFIKNCRDAVRAKGFALGPWDLADD